MKRKYKVMVLDENGKANMYETEDVTMYKAISAIENIHALQHKERPFRVTYIEEVIE